MALKKEIVLSRQSVWDIAIQYYGSINGVEYLLKDNPTVFNLETSPVAGTVFYLRIELIDKKVVEFFASQKSKPATAIDSPLVSNWILATGLWNDNAFWDDNALWID